MINEQERQILEMREAMKAIQDDSQGYHNFDTLMNMDESNMNFDTLMMDSFEDEPSVLNAIGAANRYQVPKPMKPRGQITYDLTAIYTPVAGVPGPVDITLFSFNFTPGIFVGETQVFTNAAGDFVTVTGRTASWRAMMLRSQTQPFRINFIRMNVVDDVQFSIPYFFIKNSVWGGNQDNNLSPDTFLTPEQFQLLRVDVPCNYKVDSERGIRIAIQPTEIAPKGVRMQLFIDQVNNPTVQLDGVAPVIALTADGLVQDQASIANLGYNLRKLQQFKMLQAANKGG